LYEDLIKSANLKIIADFYRNSIKKIWRIKFAELRRFLLKFDKKAAICNFCRLPQVWIV